MRILDERQGKMTRSSAVRVTDIEANDFGDDKPTSSRASTILPFNDTRDDDKEEEDVFGTEAGGYVPKRCSRLSVTVITIFPVPTITPANEREEEIKKMRDREGTLHLRRNTLMKGCDTKSFIIEMNVMYYFTRSFLSVLNISRLSHFHPLLISTQYPLHHDRGRKGESERKQCKEEAFLMQSTASFGNRRNNLWFYRKSGMPVRQ
eukprot:scaffold11583_cov45-Attheya_sp.AAC.3